jgi:type VI secretion system secreted protein VgrG
MDKHYRKDWNDEYVLTKVKYKGNQKSLFAFLPEQKKYEPTFECEFESIPFNIEFRPARKTFIPKVSGIMSAKIESGSGDEYAFIDDQGRYKAKMLFDLSDKSNGEATLPIRLTQGYSGPGYGIHFPNHADAELLWACVDGNPDRPIGLGTVPNPSTATPVTSQNKMQNVIRTAAGNELIMDDKSKESQILINTTDGNNLMFDDKDDKISISTTEKHQIMMDDKNQNITLQTKDGHQLILDDKNTKITVQSKNGHMICIEDKSGSENITLVDSSGENTFVIDITNKKLVIKTENGNIDMHAPNGTIDIKATEFKLETSGDTTVKAANIKSEAQTDYKVKGSNITEEATMDFKQKGMNIKSEASMEHKIKGLNVTSEAGVNQQVKGTMITVQSTGPNTIKGMPVMIN